MPAPVARPRRRPWLKLWHRWFGLLAGIWLLLLAVTGCAITFYAEIDTWLNPDWRVVEARGETASLRAIIANAGAALPGFAPNNIIMPATPDESILLLGAVTTLKGRVPVQLFADPYSGAVLGWRQSDRLSFDRRHLMDSLYGLHIDLKLGPWMLWLFGLVSLLWVIDHAISIILSLPRGSQWRAAFALAGRRGSLRRLFDLHRAPGMWAVPITLTLAVTGVTLAWPDDSRDALRLVSPVGERLHEMIELPKGRGAAIDIDQAIAIATARVPGRVHSVRVLDHEGAYAVRTTDPRDRDDQGRLWTYVAMAGGAVVGQRHDNGKSAGDQFFAWQYPLHSGKAFGLAGRIAVFAGGVVTIMLCMSGIMLLVRRARRTRTGFTAS